MAVRPKPRKATIPGRLVRALDDRITLSGGPYAGSTAIPGGGFAAFADCFLDDQRGADSSPRAPARIHAFLLLNLAKGRARARAFCGETVEVDCEDGSRDGAATAVMTDPGFTRTDPGGVRLAPEAYEFDFLVESGNPLYYGIAPTIKSTGKLRVTVDTAPPQVEVDFDGLVQDFPSYEMYACLNGSTPRPVFAPRSPTPGSGPGALVWPPSRRVAEGLILA